MHKTKRIVYKAATYRIGPLYNPARSPTPTEVQLPNRDRKSARPHTCTATFLTASIHLVYLSLPLELHVYRCRFVLFCSQSGLGFLELLPKAATGTPASGSRARTFARLRTPPGQARNGAWTFTLFFSNGFLKRGVCEVIYAPVVGLRCEGAVYTLWGVHVFER